MKSAFLTIRASWKRGATALLVGLTLSCAAFGQGPARDASAASAPRGTFVRKGKEIVSYTSMRDAITFRVGDTVILNAATSVNGNFFNVTHSPTKSPMFNGQGLEGDFADHRFVILKIVESDHNAWMYFKIPGFLGGYGQIKVDPALSKNEFQLAK